MRRLAAILLLCAALVGCSEGPGVTLRVRNLSMQPVTNVEVQYMGKSFGVASLQRAEARELLVHFSEPSQLSAAFTDAKGVRRAGMGPNVQKGDSGLVDIQLNDEHVIWVPQLEHH